MRIHAVTTAGTASAIAFTSAWLSAIRRTATCTTHLKKLSIQFGMSEQEGNQGFIQGRLLSRLCTGKLGH